MYNHHINHSFYVWWNSLNDVKCSHFHLCQNCWSNFVCPSTVCLSAMSLTEKPDQLSCPVYNELVVFFCCTADGMLLVTQVWQGLSFNMASISVMIVSSCFKVMNALQMVKYIRVMQKWSTCEVEWSYRKVYIHKLSAYDVAVKCIWSSDEVAV